MRKKLHPLAIHLGMAAANMEELSDFSKALGTGVSQEMAVQMMRGIQLYQQSAYSTEENICNQIWQQNGASLFHPSPTGTDKKGRALLLIPSLINKSNIFDIAPKHSILRQLNHQGINTYLFDWGNLTSGTGIKDIITQKLKPAVQHIQKETGKKVDVLGYCMGGTLLLSNINEMKQHIADIVLLATPWDFQDNNTILAKHVRIWTPYVLPVLQKQNRLPAEWIQALFASLDPNGSAKKFIKFAEMDQSSDEAKLFIAVEDWLNNGVDIPKEIARECITKWFIENALQKETSCHTDHNILIVASKKDRLVPFSCAIAAQKNITANSIKIQEAHSGHIGLIVGKHAKEEVWNPVTEWLKRKK